MHTPLTIEIHDPQHTAEEPEAFTMAMKLVYRQTCHPDSTAARVVIHTASRTKDGWLEWLVSIYNQENQRMITIGLIQRTPDSEFEAHS